MMNTKPIAEPASTSPVQAARTAIWRLFEEGYVDEDMATAGLLAVDLGTRRTRRQMGAARREEKQERRHRRAA
jgi:hypothetical protein